MFDFLNNASEKILEKTFLKLLEGFSSNDLETAAKNDMSLLLLTKQNNPKLLRTAVGIASRFRGQKHLLNMKNVMEWLKDNREGLWISTVSDNGNKAWLGKQIDEFRDFLWSS